MQWAKDRAEVLAYPSTWIGVLRLVLLAGALYWAHLPAVFVGFVTLSVGLDLVDGWLARRLGQAGRFGEVLDYGIDLITHTVLWVLSGFPFAPVLILLEWGAGFSVLWFSFRHPDHWKTLLMQAHPFLWRYFANGQRNFLAAWAVCSHFAFRIVWYLGHGETWAADIALGGTIVFEVVTAYMIWLPLRAKFAQRSP